MQEPTDAASDSSIETVAQATTEEDDHKAEGSEGDGDDEFFEARRSPNWQSFESQLVCAGAVKRESVHIKTKSELSTGLWEQSRQTEMAFKHEGASRETRDSSCLRSRRDQTQDGRGRHPAGRSGRAHAQKGPQLIRFVGSRCSGHCLSLLCCWIR